MPEYATVRRLYEDIALVVSLATALAASGCRPTTPVSIEKPATKQPAKPLGSRDPGYSGKGEVYAQHLELTQRFLLAKPTSFFKAASTQRELLEQLKSSSAVTTRVYLIDDRALLIPQARHPAGGLELLIAADRDELVVFTEDHWAHHLPFERLPDVLDRSAPSDRAGFALLGLDQPIFSAPVRRSDTQPLGQDRNTFRLTYSYTAAEELPSWSIRATLEIFTGIAMEQRPHDALFYALALPQLQTNRGRLICESLREAIGSPIGWVRTVTNDSFASAPAARLSTRIDDHGWVQLPLQRFSTVRSDYRAAGRLGPPHDPGAQLVEPTQLAALRTGKEQRALKVNNRAPLAALVYLDGAMIGWVAPGKQMAFEGLQEGFYRINAVTPTGMRAWGPYDSYVPGTVDLR